MKSLLRKRLTTLISLFLYIGLTNTAYPVVWPTSGIYPKEIESDYGPRKVYRYFHKGLDFLGGPKVKAVEDGTVVYIKETGDDRRIEIQGKASSKKVVYMHVNRLEGIKEGTIVTEGQEIATYIVPDDSYPDHLDIRFPYGTFQSNPLRDLFSPLYTGSAPLIPKFKLDVEEKEGYNLKKKGGD